LVLLGLVVDYLLFAGELGAAGAAHLVHLGGHPLNIRLELLLLLESAGGIASLRGELGVELVIDVL